MRSDPRPGQGLGQGRRGQAWIRSRDAMLLIALAAAIAVAALAIAGWSPWPVPASTLTPVPVALPTAAAVPAVQPVVNLDVPPETARRINATVPLAFVSNPPAAPFRIPGSPADARAAESCLAAAAWYEAGDDPIGQAAVMQVVLNRLRHPAFPHSVCGVVLQGSERRTGCQFSFTCDGSLDRRAPSVVAQARARATARNALQGGIFGPVGSATHYHTDYVVPRWSSEMDKLLFMHGHIFFRWHGTAGDRRMFGAPYAGGEQPQRLALRVAVPAPDGTPLETPAATGTAGDSAAPVAAEIGHGGTVRSDEWRGIYYLYLAPSAFPGSYAVKAVQACAQRQRCIVYGWDAVERVPVAVTEARPAGLAFAYTRQPGAADRSEWDCRRFPRERTEQCLAGTAPAAGTKAAP